MRDTNRIGGDVGLRWGRVGGGLTVASGLIAAGSMFARTPDPYGSLVMAVFVGAFLAGSYLAVVVVVTVFAATFRSHRLRRLLLRLTPGRLSRLIASALLLGGVSPAAANSVFEAQPGPSFVPHEQATTVSEDVQALVDRLGLSTSRPLDAVLLGTASYTVVAGDSFWRIAERCVTAAAEQAARDVTVRDVAMYWLKLVEANVDELVEAGNPDLLLVGQVLELPAVDGNGQS